MSDYTLQKTGADIDTILSNADADHAALGQPSGIATLSANGTLKEAQLPPSAINAVDFNREIDNSQGEYTVGEKETTRNYDVVWLRSADGIGRFAAMPNPSIVGQALFARWPGWEKVCTDAGLPLPEKLYRRMSDNALLARDAYKFAALTPVGMNDKDVLLKTAQSLTTEEQAQVKKNLDISKKDLFIDMWNQACGDYGRYNPDSGFFELNGLTDITYEEALTIHMESSGSNFARNYEHSFSKCRTFYSIKNSNAYFTVSDCINIFYNCTNLEAVRFDYDTGLIGNNAFWNCKKLKHIYGSMVLSTNNISCFRDCNNLITAFIKLYNYNLDIKDSPLLSLGSFQYMITHASGTSPITVTVHPDVYAKLTGETAEIMPLGATDITSGSVLDPTAPDEKEDALAWQQLVTDAAQKQITFASA